MYEINENDWMLFRANLGKWQEDYMAKLNVGYIKLLEREDLTPGDKFWKLEKRIEQDKKKRGVVAGMSRSKMFDNLLHLINERAITIDDLEPFSDELKEQILYVVKSLQ